MKLDAADRKKGMTISELEAALRMLRAGNASDDATIFIEASFGNRVKSISCRTTLVREDHE